MLELIAVLALQAGGEAPIEAVEGLRAECVLAGEIDGRRIRSLQAICPERAPEYARLQARADTLVARLAMPIDVSVSGAVRPRFELEWTGEAWRLPEPVPVYRPPPSYPHRAVERGLNAVCTGVVRIGSDGVPDEAEFLCQAYRESGRPARSRRFDRAMREPVLQSRWLIPLDRDRDCVSLSNQFQLEGAELPVDELSGPEVPTCERAVGE